MNVASVPVRVVGRKNRDHADGMIDHNGRLASAAVFFVVGALAGCGGRWWAARLRRGAVFRPPWCEAVAAGLSGILGWRVAGGDLPAWWASVPLVLGWLGVPLAAVDLTYRRLPDAMTLPAYPILGCCLTIAAWYAPPGQIGRAHV